MEKLEKVVLNKIFKNVKLNITLLSAIIGIFQGGVQRDEKT